MSTTEVLLGTGKATTKGPRVDPVHLFTRIEEKMADDSVLIVDGGDFVATGSYIVRPRGPLRWIDPGVFGTLSVGGGFAVGAASIRGPRLKCGSFTATARAPTCPCG
jgi:acetolactate synthase-1/2/3 large subunit